VTDAIWPHDCCEKMADAVRVSTLSQGEIVNITTRNGAVLAERISVWVREDGFEDF
jgi:putative intracellular protease/amidase